MADVDLRKLRYFVAVAEHLHFGRAARELFIAQPVLSRQIRALEDELGVRLFARDRRSTELTPAGEQLLADARPLLSSAEALRRRVIRAAAGSDTFTVGFMPGVSVTAPVRALAARYPDLAIDLVPTTWDDQVTVLHDGRADVSAVRLPVDLRGLRVLPLHFEPRGVVVAADHPLAGKDTVRIADLAEERLAGKRAVRIADLADDHLLQDPDTVPQWRDIATEMRGDPPAPPVFHSVEEKLAHVAAGRGIMFLPLSVMNFYTRPDIACLEVADLAPTQVGLAWLADRGSALIEEFADLAAEASVSM
ncbi:LysR family transcriptional regulator [Nocardia alni]|uniref:LysR family transcriptional regulator n=1 Tax=Nocardia alni TaxID=2815723 RepID=UPI001C23335E|nr:LysR family transcriptional regulator [Nocardia alni]